MPPPSALVPPPAPEERHVPDGFAWWSPFAALVCAYAAAIVAGAIIAGATGNADGGDLPPGVILSATFVQDVLLVVAMVGFARLTSAPATRAAFGLRRIPDGSPRVVALVLSVALLVGFFLFLAAWSRLQPETKDDLAADLGAKDSSLALVAVVLLIGFVAPIAEELFFRGFLFGALRGVLHWGPAALVAGAVFGGIHAGGTPAIFLVPLAVFGALLCLLYRYTRSLIPGMCVHATNNSIALGATLSWTVENVILLVVGASFVVGAAAWRLAE